MINSKILKVVLAAGLSKRYGLSNKILEKINAKSIIESILENLMEIGTVSTDQETMKQLRNLSGISSKEKAETSHGSQDDKTEIDESVKFDENVRDWFNLSEQSWNDMSEAGRNSLRDTYSNNNRN